MFFKKSFSFIISKSLMLILFVTVTFLLGGVKAEAASSSWTYTPTSGIWNQIYGYFTAGYLGGPYTGGSDHNGYYYASLNKDVYSPGEAATAFAWCSSPDPLIGCAISVTADTYNITNGIFDPNHIMALCGSDTNSGSGSISCSHTFNVPTTPGTYNASLQGCWFSSSYCAYSSMAFIVASPTVNLYFSALDKIKFSLGNMFAVLKTTDLVGRDFTTK